MTSAVAYSLPILATFLITSGVWVVVYFIALNKGSTENNFYYGNNATAAPDPGWSSSSLIPQPTPSPGKCARAGVYSGCTADCRFELCESIPVGLSFPPGSPFHQSTTQCWLKLIKKARREIVIGSYYWTLLLKSTPDVTDDHNTSFDGQLIFDSLAAAARRGISIRIAMDGSGGVYDDNEPLALRSLVPDRIRYRKLNFPTWFNHGILHTKAWAVDGEHAYVGSANFDWRSLTQVKEIGLVLFDCPCAAEDVQRILDIYWMMGATDAKLPSSFPAELATNANSLHPHVIPSLNSASPPQSLYLSSSPPGLSACGREDDIESMVRLIDAAQSYVYLAVMDYSPTTLYNDQNTYYSRLDDAIRRAAFDRHVKVKFMASRWSSTKQEMYAFMRSLADIHPHLPCVRNKNNKCIPNSWGELEVRMFEVPPLSYSIPFTRVQHTKYFVTEKAAYIGTSNWSADYWLYTGGIGSILSAADSGSVQADLVKQLSAVFLRDWNSNYTTPISKFDENGKPIMVL